MDGVLGWRSRHGPRTRNVGGGAISAVCVRLPGGAVWGDRCRAGTRWGGGGPAWRGGGRGGGGGGFGGGEPGGPGGGLDFGETGSGEMGGQARGGGAEVPGHGGEDHKCVGGGVLQVRHPPRPRSD